MAEETKALLTSKDEDQLPELPAGTILCEFYKVVKKIAKGGMGSIIYIVQNVNNNKYYAAKVIYKTPKTEISWNAFKDELVTCWRVNKCPNVVHTYAEDKSNPDRLVFIMDYVDGPTLRDLIHQTHLSVEETIYIFKKVAIALDSIHSFRHKIIHQDLKPENIVLSKDRSDVKILDFGIANVLVKGRDKNHILTKKEEIHGTFAYISPDVVKSVYMSKMNRSANAIDDVNKIVNEQLDFYAFGAMLFETLMSRKPFYAPDYEKKEVAELPLKYDLPIMSNENPKIPVILDNIVYRCMASKPQDTKYRYNNAKEIIADLETARKQIKQPKLTELVKPASERSFQPASKFNFKIDKSQTKFYSSKWFFFLVCFLFVAIMVALVAVLISIK